MENRCNFGLSSSPVRASLALGDSKCGATPGPGRQAGIGSRLGTTRGWISLDFGDLPESAARRGKDYERRP